jgi:hypothetical protein
MLRCSSVSERLGENRPDLDLTIRQRDQLATQLQNGSICAALQLMIFAFGQFVGLIRRQGSRNAPMARPSASMAANPASRLHPPLRAHAHRSPARRPRLGCTRSSTTVSAS